MHQRYYICMVKMLIKENWLSVIAVLLVTLPWLLNIAIAYQSDINYIFDGSVFSLDYVRFFNELLNEQSHYMNGFRSPNLVNYFPFYGLLALSQLLVGNQAISYLVTIALLYAISSIAMIAWMEEFVFVNPYSAIKKNEHRAYVSFFAVAYYSTISQFVYLKGTILMTLPYIALPICLWAIRKYCYHLNSRYLLIVIGTCLLMLSVNLTYLIYIWLACIIYLIYQINLKGTAFWGEFFKSSILISLAFVPAGLILLLSLYSMAFQGNLVESAKTYSESHYFINSSILNAFRQTLDWSIFGADNNGKRYHQFSYYYENPWVMFLGFIPWMVGIFLVLMKYRNNPNDRRNLGILSILLLCIGIGAGYSNPVWLWLYDNIFIFQIFRNSNKIAPLLWLLLLILIISQVFFIENRRLRNILSIGTVIASLLYGLPYWTHSKDFISSRYVSKIPANWLLLSNYVHENLNSNTKVLLLPETHIQEVYFWGERDVMVMGTLTDVLFNVKGYRLSPILVGYPQLQNDFSDVFSWGTSSYTGAIDWIKLFDIIRMHGIEYVLVTEDLSKKQELHHSINPFLAKIGFDLIWHLNGLKLYKILQVELQHNPLSQIGAVSIGKIANNGYLYSVVEPSQTMLLEIPEPENSNWSVIEVSSNELRECIPECSNGGIKRIIYLLGLLTHTELKSYFVKSNRKDKSLLAVETGIARNQEQRWFVVVFKAQLHFIVLAIIFSILTLGIAIMFLLKFRHYSTHPESPFYTYR